MVSKPTVVVYGGLLTLCVYVATLVVAGTIGVARSCQSFVAVQTRTHSLSENLVLIAAFIVVISLFILLRLGTFRELITGSGEYRSVQFNHKETDERIFEALVQSVSMDIGDYSLGGKPIVDQLRLSPENYGDSLFIHPPNFVYSSMLIQRLTGLSLPAVSVVYHIFSLCLIPCIVQLGNFGIADTVRGTTAAWAMVVFTCCPIAMFCSQKFWIDNALIASVTLSVALHIWINKYAIFSFSRSLLSGFLFGAIVMNCKVTGLALLPFLVAWSSCRDIRSLSLSADKFIVVKRVFFETSSLLLGAGLAHGPWVFLYWVNILSYIFFNYSFISSI